MKQPTLRLITIPISHYCEKVRWALDWLKIPYIEERHAPVFHRLATMPQGGQSVPVLLTSKGAFTDSTDILHYLDAIASSDRHLYPTNPDLRREVEQLEELFDEKLGIHIRRWGYFHRVNDRQSMLRGWRTGAPPLEQIGCAIAFPLIVGIVKRSYNVTAETAANSLLEIEQVFDTVNRQLADARSYLVGESLSAADITFAALAAPILFPPEHPVKISQLEELPNELAAIIQKMRSTPAGAHALRLYREQRHPR